MTRMRRRGFTLLEVMVATAVLAVGTVSVLMVFATALSFAHKRAGRQQVTQVLQEARADARARVNAWRPQKTAGEAPAKPRDRKAAPVTVSTPAGEGPETKPQPSKVFSAYTYHLRFEPEDREAPEAGWRTTVVLQWGDGQEYVETLVVTPDVIPPEEFAYSETYEDERRGREAGGQGSSRETR